MNLDDKASENLEAAERLLSTADGRQLPLCNAAASRAYYAAYLAVSQRALARRVEFDSAKEYFRHDALPGNAVRWGILDAAGADDLAWLHELRVRADYWEDQVSYAEVSDAFSVAKAILEEALR